VRERAVSIRQGATASLTYDCLTIPRTCRTMIVLSVLHWARAHFKLLICVLHWARSLFPLMYHCLTITRACRTMKALCVLHWARALFPLIYHCLTITRACRTMKALCVLHWARAHFNLLFFYYYSYLQNHESALCLALSENPGVSAGSCVVGSICVCMCVCVCVCVCVCARATRELLPCMTWTWLLSLSLLLLQVASHHISAGHGLCCAWSQRLGDGAGIGAAAT
jgi:hypothetical protein